MLRVARLFRCPAKNPSPRDAGPRCPGASHVGSGGLGFGALALKPRHHLGLQPDDPAGTQMDTLRKSAVLSPADRYAFLNTERAAEVQEALEISREAASLLSCTPVLPH